ncbi:helix-turn-helix domain-containing protein [Pyxidicoccus xibeiensis]|uniref:helix-turn-helix domain-containing protein n=1 Tax=Pyxidicoccus xibeiensis TaxID=2906759 RepID=UPI0020A6F791|nr:PTS sugar transporter subunit IIA [Pyxidicoccus xibeiensis]MCP3141925.1 PTS sugar transporter subunit IIA [Pyxidicoccus xibeiensis]
MHFGATLRLLRVDAGLSLRDLARRIGVSGAYLSRVENGLDAVPTPERLSAIARELDVPPTLLVDVAHRVNPFVASYLEQEPGARALVLDLARRQLTGAQLARLRELIDREFAPPAARKEAQSLPLAPLLAPERIVLGLSCSGLEDALDVAAGRLAAMNPDVSASSLAARLRQREEEVPSAVGNGVAVPHAFVSGWAPQAAALVTLASPLRTETPDGLPLRLLVVLVGTAGRAHLMRLAHVARLASDGLVDQLGEARSSQEVLERIGELDALA